VTNEGEVYFGLWGDDFDPDKISELLGIEPTSTARKGNPRPVQTSWKLSTGEVKADIIDVYEMSSALVKRLEPIEGKIIEAIAKYKLEAVLQVVLWVTTDDTKPTPAIGFEPEVIKFLSSVGASVDVDTYRN